MKDTFRLCRECGKPVAVIKRGLYRKILVDASPVDVFPDEHGEEFIRLDGSKMRAVPADRWDDDRWDDDRKEAEYVFRPHRCRRKA